jgi:ribonuclease VapC
MCLTHFEPAVDTSALMAIVPGEPEADACSEALQAEDELLISAGTVGGADRRGSAERRASRWRG